MSDTAIHVSLVAVPDAMLSTLTSIYDALNSFELLEIVRSKALPIRPFETDIVTSVSGEIETASGLPVTGHRTIRDIDHTEIVIIPSMMVKGGAWVKGRYPKMVDWLRKMHQEGAIMCSACSGVLLLAETGLLDAREATIHWAYAQTFRENFPNVRLRVEEVLITAGDRREFVMSGASASWHDLVLYLVAHHVGTSAAQAIAKFMLLQWHTDGQKPYIVFNPPRDHGDAVVLDAQEWFERRFSVGSPVEEALRRSSLPERSFKRRFRRATGYPPIKYVQHVRVEEAKRLLESSEAPIDQIGWDVGYQEPSFFRRLFKRTTGMTPGAYRRKFKLPDINV